MGIPEKNACVWGRPLFVPKELTASIRQLISRCIRSVEELEILVLVADRAREEWTVEKVYDVILSTRPSVERWLEELAQNDLLEKISGSPVRYRFAAAGPAAGQVADLVLEYRTRPVRIISAIYQRETDVAQGFADAFKLRNPTDQP